MVLATIYKKLGKKQVIADAMITAPGYAMLVMVLEKRYGPAITAQRHMGSCYFYGTESHVIKIEKPAGVCTYGFGESKPFRWTGPEA